MRKEICRNSGTINKYGINSNIDIQKEKNGQLDKTIYPIYMCVYINMSFRFTLV